ncbi:hypothetical protein BDZ85DRAFT_261795 [Elsinoe ampelina]|uniref:Uncharacterized protein n=1 Tax=Elsinoe ampelina TaxID=302913 RepID=A0A6A6GD36_9PEZI|nr:hypothetical protein BDZ85DRAFT_261795 [Elsinoe ampelina]
MSLWTCCLARGRRGELGRLKRSSGGRGRGGCSGWPIFGICTFEPIHSRRRRCIVPQRCTGRGPRVLPDNDHLALVRANFWH